MGSRTPDPWETALLAAASYRLWKLASEDTIADRPREWVLARTPEWVEDFLGCPWCAGFWISLGAVGAHRAAPRATLAAAAPFAVSAAVGAVAHFLDA